MSSSFKVDKYPLADNTAGIVSQVEEILIAGAGDSIVRIEIEIDKPIRVLKRVSEEMLDDPGVDLPTVLKMVPITEYYSEGATPYQTLVDMTCLLSGENLNATCWATGPNETGLLDSWLEVVERGMPEGVDYLLGHKVIRLKQLPEETLILCGSEYQYSEPSEIQSAIKTAIEIRRNLNGSRVLSSEVNDSVRPNTGEHDEGVCRVALSTTGLRTVEWEGPSYS